MTEDKEPSCIPDYMKCILDNYNRIRGKVVDLSETPFWNAVLISASDSSQEKGYEFQIVEKQKRGELPLSIPFHVFADPPGFKIGCGGSTMYVLEKVFEMYGDAMHKMRFLLIPAGGYSQRLLNLSVLGKLFSPLPFGESRYQMLDLILASYLPFLKCMPSGVFLASSDALISYSLLDNDSWTFENGGFTALAHPSPVIIGTTHGVYVLPKNEEVETGSAFMSECLHVLQKPSIDEMTDKGAIVKSVLSGTVNEEEIIYSDSAFFFDHTVITTLINFYRDNKPLKCELSSYGDFLQPLGLSASSSYITDKVTADTLASVRSALYRDLQGTKLSILVLKNSNFHHLGTMKEYIGSLCGKNSFSEAFPASKFSFSTFSQDKLVPLYVQGTVIHSVIHPLSIIPWSTVLEYCDLDAAVNIGVNCIISNIQLHDISVLDIPDNTLLHTVILKDGFVTMAFNVHADIKKVRKCADALELVFFGHKLKDFLKEDDPVFDVGCDEVSLWNARLFPVCSSAAESLQQTLEIVWNVNDSNYILERKDLKWVSMSDVLLLKDTEGMLSYQNKLYEKIMLQRKEYSHSLL